MTQKRTQLSVFVVAALAIVALVGVALLASGGAPAQATATIIAPGVEGNSMPQQQTPATPEACPGDESRPNEQAARVVDSGHYRPVRRVVEPGGGGADQQPLSADCYARSGR